MEAVVGLLLMMCGVSHGVETYCNGRQNGTQCYEALGRTVDIQLMNHSLEIPRYTLSRNSVNVLLDVKNNTVIRNVAEHRSLFIPTNATFRINNLNRNDSDNYTLQTFDSNGRSLGVWTLQLFIQAPVSSVLLVSECLSQGEMRVSCSSEGGDSPQYSWTLDGRTLTDAELLSGNNKTNNITLKQHVSGHLVCSVRNNVSDVSKEQWIATCEADFLPLIGGVVSALLILLVVGVALVCVQRKKQKNKSTKKAEKEDQEVMYADVRVMQQQGKPVDEGGEEVLYGQVKFS
ncbi:hepatocyte cell adhesion molecule-like isoform X1 [Oreochromis niloticus]|uniref:hepatocyte cell adhesion molecule-like isoform X1 n=1 Tax=Oreochromis niloticus TaxID=8128 RepID=UPI00039468EB|nr:hepatocyte cell adhesion molecule-like isoform X1 [Oreochromis niloticus]